MRRWTSRRVAVVRGARAVYLVGDQPLHLRSVLKATPLWDAIAQVRADGGVVAATGGSADAMCDPMVDPRGGAFTLGLGLVSGIALVTEAETWSAERLHRTLKLANTPVVGVTERRRAGAHRRWVGTGRRRDRARRASRDDVTALDHLTSDSGFGDGHRLHDDLLQRRHTVGSLIGVAERVERGHRRVEPVGDLTEQRVVRWQ